MPHSEPTTRLALLVMALMLSVPKARGDYEKDSPPGVVEVGHWLQIRGELQADGRFRPRNIELVDPERYDELIGTVESFEPESGRFLLLGVPVQIGPDTRFARLERNALGGQRVKVEGYYEKKGVFSARKIAKRGAGLDRITGRVERVHTEGENIELQILDFTVPVPAGVEIEHVRSIATYRLADSRIEAIVDRGKDEEDLFGKGTRLTENLRVATQMQTSVLTENEFDLDSRDSEDVVDYLVAFKARAIFNAGERFFSVFELNYRRLWREHDEDGRSDIRNKRIGEAYMYWLDPLGIGLDFQIGRSDFDDEREWLYDRFLDGPRLIWVRNSLRAELSLTTTLSSGSPVDEEATNAILYLSNNDEDRHLAGYVVHRDFDFPLAEERTHYGMRVLGEWLPDHKIWLELSRMRGESPTGESAGWGVDVGSTWQFDDRFALTVGYALGTGDRDSTVKDETFRQTGMQDNNAKFAGVSSFRVYGEVVDPELANLEVLTLGLTWMPHPRISLDLVGHQYRQHRLSRRWVDAQIDRNPNGRDTDLGRGLDLILGWRTSRRWDLELVVGWFQPGDAFNRQADDAYSGRMQFRYRP